jgi:mRNA interferase RelE/StbE
MKIEVRKAFEKDIQSVINKKLALQITSVLNELERCTALSEINNIKKMKAKGDYYRIRIGNYRLGLKQESGTLILLRFMARKDIYTYFP